MQGIPEGFHTLTPYLCVRGAAELIEFLKQAFDAQEIDRHTTPEGVVFHAAVKIGDSMVFVGEAPKELGSRALMPAMLYMYVHDVDAVYAKAIQAGGKSIREPADQFYGDRSGAVEDAAGNQWWVATHKEDVTHEELSRRASLKNG
jgi:uncharacterized glyoxalase superfamily protein PhnB